MERLFYSWENLCVDLKAIIAEISLSGWMPEVILGIKNGGIVPAVVLSNYMQIPMLVASCRVQEGVNVVNLLEANELLKEKSVLVVDDFCYEGLTFQKIKEELSALGINNTKFFSVFFNIRQNFPVDFKARKVDSFKDTLSIVFPWEV